MRHVQRRSAEIDDDVAKLRFVRSIRWPGTKRQRGGASSFCGDPKKRTGSGCGWHTLSR